MRMARYTVQNDGQGPYAIFYCDKCEREYRSQPNIVNTIGRDVGKSVLGGFLRNVPLVGDVVGGVVESDEDHYRTNMSTAELDKAWSQVQQYFHECPTCHQIVCPSDWDAQTNFCIDDSQRQQEIREAQGRQAAGFVKGIADVFGVSDAVKKAAATAQAGLATCPSCGTKAPAGTNFCPNCGTKMTQPTPPPTQTVAAPATSTCPNCGAQVPAGQKFCGECGHQMTGSA